MNVFSANRGPNSIPFSFDSDWVKLYMGKRGGNHVLGCKHLMMSVIVCRILTSSQDDEFTQLMKGLQGERLRQAFKYLDKNQDGFITPDNFKRIVLVSLKMAKFNYAIALSGSLILGARWA